MEDKQNKFLDKVLESLIRDTKIDYENNRIKFPFSPSFLFSPPLLSLSTPSLIFSTYCKGTYGLSEQEIEQVWKKYRSIIIDKINNKESINESADKQKKFLDKVVGFLVEDTIINHENNTIKFPFPRTHPSILTLSPPYWPLTVLHGTSFFSTYCKEMYGLTDKEIEYTWEKYRNSIEDKINDKGNINESEDKQKKYLDKVVGFLVEDTIIDYDNNKIKFPFRSSLSFYYPSSPSPFPSLLPLLSLLRFPSYFFSTYCKGTYGLTDQEIRYLWKEYKDIILDKINNKI